MQALKLITVNEHAYSNIHIFEVSYIKFHKKICKWPLSKATKKIN
jgi:hypothetical protein